MKKYKKLILPNRGSLRKIKVTADVIIITVIRKENYTFVNLFFRKIGSHKFFKTICGASHYANVACDFYESER